MQILNRNIIMLSATMFALFTTPALSIAATVFTNSADFIIATDEDEFAYTFSKTTDTGFLFVDYEELEETKRFNVLTARSTEPQFPIGSTNINWLSLKFDSPIPNLAIEYRNALGKGNQFELLFDSEFYRIELGLSGYFRGEVDPLLAEIEFRDPRGNSDVLEYGFIDNLENGNVSHISSFSIPGTVWFMGSGLLAFLGFSIKNQDPSVAETNVAEFNYTKLAERQLLKSDHSHQRLFSKEP